jgi:RNAse (barnase) inhibitor barstar
VATRFQIGQSGVVTDPPKGLREYELDGASFDDLEGFFRSVGAALDIGDWGRNLDAFNDILRGGFGTPDEGFVLRWFDSQASSKQLGWDETIRWIERKLTTCHPDNIPSVQADLEAARNHEGHTLFEIIVGIVREHGPGGREAQDNVHLLLA